MNYLYPSMKRSTWISFLFFFLFVFLGLCFDGYLCLDLHQSGGGGGGGVDLSKSPASLAPSSFFNLLPTTHNPLDGATQSGFYVVWGTGNHQWTPYKRIKQPPLESTFYPWWDYIKDKGLVILSVIGLIALLLLIYGLLVFMAKYTSIRSYEQCNNWTAANQWRDNQRRNNNNEMYVIAAEARVYLPPDTQWTRVDQDHQINSNIQPRNQHNLNKVMPPSYNEVIRQSQLPSYQDLA